MSQASRDLEILVAKIQQQLAPKAEVLHNVKLEGRHTKIKRQVDVLVREKIGQYEIKFIIDCKDYAEPVDVKAVEEFSGLLQDVGAQKGVLVCPKGFTSTAKVRAEGLQIDLYSPVDTDPHKWQAKVTIPALCDFRNAMMGFQITCSAPVPFTLPMDFYSAKMIYDAESKELGTALQNAKKKWNSGQLPLDIGEHSNIGIFDAPNVLMDNGHGMKAPVGITVSLFVQRELYFGQLPVPRFSGFKDELSGKIISNAFTVGILSPEEVERDWKKIGQESDAPVRPVITLVGIVGWTEEGEAI